MDVAITRRAVLIYDFVDGDVLALRAPHRPAHLARVREALADGRVPGAQHPNEPIVARSSKQPPR